MFQFKRASSYEVLDSADDHNTSRGSHDGDARAQLMAEVYKMRDAAQMSTLTRYSKDYQSGSPGSLRYDFTIYFYEEN